MLGFIQKKKFGSSKETHNKFSLIIASDIGHLNKFSHYFAKIINSAMPRQWFPIKIDQNG